MTLGPKAENIKGRVFGDYYADRVAPRKKGDRLQWIIICRHCGRDKKVTWGNLKRYPTPICICQKETAAKKVKPAAYRGGDKFNPDREYVESAVEEYLRNGGEVTQIEIEEDLKDCPTSPLLDDEFKGEHPKYVGSGNYFNIINTNLFNGRY